VVVSCQGTMRLLLYDCNIRTAQGNDFHSRTSAASPPTIQLSGTGDILPALKHGASHARLRWFGNLPLRPDVPMGVPRPRYSYPAKDSEVPDYFMSVGCPKAYLFGKANTKSTASLRTVKPDGVPSNRHREIRKERT